MSRRFLRSDTERYLRLGKKKRKLQKWRRPRGKHNKIRLKRFGYPIQPGIGFSSQKKEANRIKGLIPVLIYNVNGLLKLSKENIAIIAHVGAKKKLEIIKKADELKIPIANLNVGGKK
jgi:large subunit ribosomal protein L32e